MWEWLFSVCWEHACLGLGYHFGVNWPTTLSKNKDGVHFFTLNFQCHNRYNKLLAYCVIQEILILHDATKTIQKWVFVLFLQIRIKTCLIKKNKKWVFLNSGGEWQGEISLCQLTGISECDFTIQERLIDIQIDDEARVIFHAHAWALKLFSRGGATSGFFKKFF